jgi:nucleotide-binding universal stress UspA family protein
MDGVGRAFPTRTEDRLVARAPVLAAFDPVALDPAPVRLAAMLAAYTEAPLLVASACSGANTVDALAAGQLGEADLAPDTGRMAERVVAELRREGVAAERLALGATSPSRALSLAAEQLGAGVIAVGSAAAAEPGRVAVGSTGARLLNGAPCAVAVAPLEWAPRTDPTVIGAGFVDSAEGRDALHGAHMLADRAGTVLRVLTVVQPRAWMLGDGPWPAREGGRRDDELAALAADIRAQAESAAQAATAGLLGAPVDVDVLEGEPDDVLRSASAEVDLLVCGSRGYGPPSATLMGGVARRLAADAACPLIVTARAAVVGLEELLTD